LLLVGLAFPLVCLFVSLQTEARTSPACECNRNAPDIVHSRWLPNSTLRVMFARGDFSSKEIAAFQEAIRLWQAALPRSTTGIDLQMGGEIAGSSSTTTSCTSCIIVKRKPDLGGTFASLSMASNGGFYSKASINIKSDVHKTTMLRMLLTHELGHAFGLDDCEDCDGNTTVMNSVNKYAFGSFAFLAPRNKMASAPTPCDVARVSAGYAGAATAALRDASARNVQLVAAQDRSQSRSISYQPVTRASASETSPRNHARRSTGQPQRSVKIEQLALMDAIARRD
jgi:hypothetical protein